MNELIQQARELCEKAETEFWYVKDSRWHCGKPILTQLYDALEAETTRAEKAEAERDTFKLELSHLEHMVSHERSRNGKREHSWHRR